MNKNDTQEIDRKVQDAWRRDSDVKADVTNAPKQDGANPFAGMPGLPPTVKSDGEPNPFAQANAPARIDAATGLPIYQEPLGKWIDHPKFGHIFEAAERADRSDSGQRETRNG